MAVVDLLAIAPFFLSFLGVDVRILRIARLFRVFRIARLGRYSAAMQVLVDVGRSRRVELVRGSRVNLSKSGASVTAGRRGSSMTMGKRGTNANPGEPERPLGSRAMIRCAPPSAFRAA